MSRPMIRYGARGEHVTVLQQALNLWPKSQVAKLEPDGIFGMKTRGKVLEFQRLEGTASDGIVGPNTWALLEPFIDALVESLPVPHGDEEAIGRILVAAESALTTFGWGTGPVVLDPNSPRIAAAYCADPSRAERPRQGAWSLRSIFQIAGAPAAYHSRCLTITAAAEAKWQQAGAAATGWRNANDLPAWCGIFAYYVYRIAGIDLGGWVSHSDNIHVAKKFKQIHNPSQAHPGCIGVLDGIRGGGRNHHFVVTGNDGNFIESIDGNAHGPAQMNFQSNYSTIARRRYSHSELKQKDTYFLFPDFAKLTKSPVKALSRPTLRFAR